MLLLRHGHIDALGEESHRIREGEVLLLHDEIDDAAALFAAEAVADLLVGRDRERAGLFVVEGAEAEVVRTLFRQRYIVADDVDDIVPGDELI